MTAKEKQGFGLYFLLAFGMAWLCQIGGCMALLQQENAVLYQLALIGTMFCPLLAVLLVQKAFLRQPTGIGWKVQGKRRFWLAAWFGPAVLTLLGAVLYFAVFPSRLDFSGSWLVAAYGGEMDAQTLRSELGVSTLSYLLQNGLFAVLLAPAINMFPALGEEVGWRGYMMPRLKEQYGIRCQVNAATVLEGGFFQRRKLDRWLKDGLVDAISSDAHNCTTRATRMQAAYERLCGILGQPDADALTGRNNALLLTP